MVQVLASGDPHGLVGLRCVLSGFNKSGEHAGQSSTSTLDCWINVMTSLGVWGLALSCCRVAFGPICCR